MAAISYYGKGANMDSIKKKICQEVDGLADKLYAVSDYLKENPETAYKEFKACEHLCGVLRGCGFNVEKGVGNVETSFLAKPSGISHKRPRVAFLAEYDALPGIGHGCGHNLIAAASLGAAIALSRSLGDDAGALAVVGTPAEEGGGGKALLAQAGVFKDMDAAMMFHPGSTNLPGRDTLGRIKFKMEFFGKTAHAAGSPDQGFNALDAIVLAYNSLNSLRQHLKSGGYIHGIITHGGDAPNIIPDYTAGLFYVRANDIKYLDELFERVKKCAEGAALSTGTETKIEIAHPKLDPLRRNIALEAAAQKNMETLGIFIDKDDGRRGSSDVGNLSRYLPVIHPFLAIAEDIPGHSVSFCEATMSPKGRDALLNAAKMLAMTAYDFLTSAELRKKVVDDFKQTE